MRRYVFCQHDEADRVWKPPAGKAAGSHYLDDIMKEGEKFLSQEEYTYIRAVGMRAEKEMAAKCMDIIRGLCTEEEVASGHMGKHEFLMTSVISYLGNIGEIDTYYYENVSDIMYCAADDYFYKRNSAGTVTSRNIYGYAVAQFERGNSVQASSGRVYAYSNAVAWSDGCGNWLYSPHYYGTPIS